MAIQTTRTYDLAQVICKVGTLSMSGYGETDGISFEYASDIIEDTVGADGEVTVSVNNDNRMYVNITVMETSEANALLASLQRAQEVARAANGGSYVALPFYFEDPINGDIVSEAFAVFKQTAPPSKSKTVSERTYRLLLPNARSNEIIAAARLPTA